MELELPKLTLKECWRQVSVKVCLSWGLSCKERYSWEIQRDIVERYSCRVEIYIPLLRANSPGLTPEGRCLSPGKGNFRNGRRVASYFSLREYVNNLSTLQITWETLIHLPPLPEGTQKLSSSTSPTFPIEALLVCINCWGLHPANEGQFQYCTLDSDKLQRQPLRQGQPRALPQ